MYQIISKVEAKIGEGEWQCEFVCDTESDVAKLPTSVTAGTGGKTVYDNHKCEAGSSAYIVDDNAFSKLYILNNQNEWVPQGSGSDYSGGGGSYVPVTAENITEALGYTPADDAEVTQLKSDLSEEVTARQTAVATEKAERKAEIAVERERINLFTALPEGSTIGDAELIDARIDYKGITHDNVGEHIRTVTSALNSGLLDLEISTSDVELGKIIRPDRMYDNEYYYTTPYIEITNGQMVWLPSEVDSTIYIIAYDAEKNRVNQWLANNSTVTKNLNAVASAKYVRTSFKYDCGGSISIDGNIVWDNYVGLKNELVAKRKQVSELEKSLNDINTSVGALTERVNNLMKEGYKYYGAIKTTDEPLESYPNERPFYFACEVGEYTNFLGVDDNPITTNNRNISIIRGVTYNGVVTRWAVESINDAFSPFIDYFTKGVFKHIEYVGEGNSANTILGKNQAGAKTVGVDLSGNTGIGCNVAVGYSNMTNNTGVKNIAIGNQNMMDSTGSYNVGIGYHSCFRMTSGNNNTGLGTETLDDTTVGNENTALGSYAMQRNYLGSYNTAVGYRALNGNLSKKDETINYNYNVAIGHKAMESHKVGDNNIAIGYKSGNVDGLNNTISVGHNVSADESNSIKIGNSSHESVIIAGKKIIFNSDGSVTWENIT